MFQDSTNGQQELGRGHLSRWRLNSPFVQAMIVAIIVFCEVGMTNAVTGLGAGGSYPGEITTVDKITVASCVVTVVLGMFGGSVNNQLGPRFTLMIGSTGYPIYIAAFWYLDQGHGAWFGYLAAVWHGISAAMFYSATGYIVTAYSTEYNRGTYVMTFWAAVSLGSAAGAAIVLGITATRTSKVTHVPSSVYIVIVTIQCLGCALTALLQAPASIRRNDGRAIAIFKQQGWMEELVALPKTLVTKQTLLLAIPFFSAAIPVSFFGSVNAFYFNGRTRALVNQCFWIAAFLGSLASAYLSDARILGRRRIRARYVGGLVSISMIGTWSAILWFLSTHDLNRHKKARGIDWKHGADFSGPLIIYFCLGWCWGMLQGYLQWLCSTFSNAPITLGRYSGFGEGLRAAGYGVAYGIDSHATPFLTEAAIYFSLLMAGLIASLVASSLYTSDSKYGQEAEVIVPEVVEREEAFSSSVGSSLNESKRPWSGRNSRDAG